MLDDLPGEGEQFAAIAQPREEPWCIRQKSIIPARTLPALDLCQQLPIRSLILPRAAESRRANGNLSRELLLRPENLEHLVEQRQLPVDGAGRWAQEHGGQRAAGPSIGGIEPANPGAAMCSQITAQPGQIGGPRSFGNHRLQARSSCGYRLAELNELGDCFASVTPDWAVQRVVVDAPWCRGQIAACLQQLPRLGDGRNALPELEALF